MPKDDDKGKGVKPPPDPQPIIVKASEVVFARLIRQVHELFRGSGTRTELLNTISMKLSELTSRTDNLSARLTKVFKEQQNATNALKTEVEALREALKNLDVEIPADIVARLDGIDKLVADVDDQIPDTDGAPAENPPPAPSEGA